MTAATIDARSARAREILECADIGGAGARSGAAETDDEDDAVDQAALMDDSQILDNS